MDYDDKGFTITSIARSDLINQGFDGANVDDATMERLAAKMANAYVENSFWVDLDIIAEDLDIPRLDQQLPESISDDGSIAK